MQRMLARVFLEPAGHWILKGGTSLLVRIPGARHSQDLDLLHLNNGLEQAFEELHALVSAPSQLDRFTFQLRIRSRNDNEGATPVWKLQSTPMLGTKRLQHFPIDLTAGKQLVGAIDWVTPTPTIDIDDVEPSPRLACYPLVDQIGDKLAAMYEYHGEARIPSSRWRDLVDLLLIIRTSDFDAELFRRSLDHQRRHRPTLELPSAIVMPGPRWKESYPATARMVRALPAELHLTDAAFEYLGRCVNPVLDGTVTAGTWISASQSWQN
ncbi:nucleotidyl transferase AbiEii/AbiGii toxin family protein [Nocardia sp. NPDC003979]